MLVGEIKMVTFIVWTHQTAKDHAVNLDVLCYMHYYYVYAFAHLLAMQICLL